MVTEPKESGKEPEKNMNAKGSMMCPVCNVSLTMSERQGVEIDYCPECRGVWLDRGELDKIIERSAVDLAPPAPQSAPEPDPRGYEERSGYGYGKHGGGHHGGYGKHGGYRRKSWLAEIFD